MLGGSILVDEALDLLELGVKYFGRRADAEFILYGGYELLVELVMGHVELIL